MSSKFFGGPDSSSDSDSGSSSSSEDEKPQQKTVNVKKDDRDKRWVDSESSDDDAGKKRTIRSGVDKRHAALLDVMKSMRNHMKINDFGALNKDYQDAISTLQKLQNTSTLSGFLTLRTGSAKEMPKFYIKAMYDLEEYIQKIYESGEKKTWQQNKAKAYNTLRAKVRKGNMEYEDHFSHLKENPDEYEMEINHDLLDGEDGDASSDDDSDDDAPAGGGAGGVKTGGASGTSPPKKSGGGKKKDKGSDSDSDSDSSSGSSSSDSDSDSDSDSSSDSGSDYSISSESSVASDMDFEMIRARRRRRWLKTEADYEAERRVKEQKERIEALAEERAAKRKLKTAAGQTKINKDSSDIAGSEGIDDIRRLEDPDNTIDKMKTIEMEKRVMDVVNTRGRKTNDRKTFGQKLQFYSTICNEHNHGPAIQLFLLNHLTLFEFDSYSGAWFENLALERWEKSLGLLQKMFDLVQNFTEKEAEAAASRESKGDKSKLPRTEKEIAADEAAAAKSSKKTRGGVAAEVATTPNDDISEDFFLYDNLFRMFMLSVVKLDDELYKAMQFSSKETQEFLIASCRMLAFMKNILNWLMVDGGPDQPFCAKIASRVLEHIYYKTDEDNRHSITFMKDELNLDLISTHNPELLGDWTFDEPGKSFALIELLCKIIQRGCTGNQTIISERVLILRSELCKCFHFALHGKFRQARDILHYMSMYERSLEVETSTQILYNRAFAQTGLCAFRLGLIPEAHHYLMELCTYNKSKELLAQGVAFQRFNERNPEQEKTERRRQLPYHMHISLDQLDAAHLVAGLLLEIPNMLLQQLNPGHRGRLISKALRKYLDTMEKHVFQTPPETTREYILHAAVALYNGDWKSAMHKHLARVKFLSELVDLSLLEKKIKEESLRCYCLRHATAYDSLDLKQLAEMFELPEKNCHSICSRMILDNEVPFAWDKTSKILLVRHEDSQTKFQRLTQTLADKCGSQLEHHERMVDYKTGNYMKGEGHQNRDNNRGMGFRDVYSEEVRYFNRTKYVSSMQRHHKGGLITGSKGRKGGKSKGKGHGYATNSGKGNMGGYTFGGQDGESKNNNRGGYGGKGFGGPGSHSGPGAKGGARIDTREGLNVRATGWNRGARDYAVGFAYAPKDNRATMADRIQM